MSYEPKRRLEEYLVSKLQAAVPGHAFRPMTGLGKNETVLEPPFTVVTVTWAEKTHHDCGIYVGTGSVQVVTHFQEVGSEAHAALVENIHKALGALLEENTGGGFAFSGLDVGGLRTASDQENQAHVDAIDFVAGFSS